MRRGGKGGFGGHLGSYMCFFMKRLEGGEAENVSTVAIVADPHMAS